MAVTVPPAESIDRLAEFGLVEAVALANELRELREAARDTDAPADHLASLLHSHRLTAWKNLNVIQDALYGLGNEIDKLGA